MDHTDDLEGFSSADDAARHNQTAFEDSAPESLLPPPQRIRADPAAIQRLPPTPPRKRYRLASLFGLLLLVALVSAIVACVKAYEATHLLPPLPHSDLPHILSTIPANATSGTAERLAWVTVSP